jgi:hypothetical protein
MGKLTRPQGMSRRRPSARLLASLIALAGLAASPLPAAEIITPEVRQNARDLLKKILPDGGPHTGRSAFVTHGNRAQRARQLAGMIHKNSGNADVSGV